MTLKAGNRHSADDRKRIKEARSHARSIDTIMVDLGDTDDEEEAPDEIKQMSLSQRVMNVMQAVYRAAPAGDVYIPDVFDDYAILQIPGNPVELYRVDYTIDALGGISVSPRESWQRMEQAYMPLGVPAVESWAMHMGGGITVKATASGELAVGGYLVRFGNPQQTDLSGEFFTKDTDFGFAESMESDVYFNHRLPLKTRAGEFVVIKERIGHGVLTKDDNGVLIDAILFNREQYEAVLSALGWSSGTASHLVDYEQVGKATWIKAWPLGLDASLTPMPNEPRNSAWQIKTLAPPEGHPQAAGNAGGLGGSDIRIIKIRRIEHG